MKQKLIALGLCLALFGGGGAAAQELPRLEINGVGAEGAAHVENGVTYVSLRTVSEYLDPDAQVSWEMGRAVVRGEGLDLSAVPGEKWLISNDRYVYIAGGVKLENGKTLVPIRALAEAFGAEVSWDGSTNTIRVETLGIPPVAMYDGDAVYWLSRIISAESRGEELEGQIAVGNVVLNRVKDEAFPDTVYGVIFDNRWGGQFEPVRNGMIYQEPAEQSVIAAKLCLGGASVVGESLYFLNPKKAENLWTVYHRTYLMSIGVHDFYQ